MFVCVLVYVRTQNQQVWSIDRVEVKRMSKRVWACKSFKRNQLKSAKQSFKALISMFLLRKSGKHRQIVHTNTQNVMCVCALHSQRFSFSIMTYTQTPIQTNRISLCSFHVWIFHVNYWKLWRKVSHLWLRCVKWTIILSLSCVNISGQCNSWVRSLCSSVNKLVWYQRISKLIKIAFLSFKFFS